MKCENPRQRPCCTVKNVPCILRPGKKTCFNDEGVVWRFLSGMRQFLLRAAKAAGHKKPGPRRGRCGMGGYSGLLNVQLMQFCLIGIGVLTAKLKLVDGKVRSAFSELVISLFLPCNIIVSFMVPFERRVLFSLLTVLGIGFGTQGVAILLNKLIYRWVPEDRRKVMQYGTICSNAGFMGNPVVEGIFGADYVVYASAYLVPMRIMMWTAGLAYFTTTSRRQAVKKILRHPCIIATALGFVLMVTGLQLPGFLYSTLQGVGRCTTPISMLVIGNILEGIPARAALNRHTFYYSAVRLLLVPLLSFGALLLLRPDTMLMEMSVVLAAMPAGSTTTILAEKYGADAGFASQITFVTVLLSMVSIPLWVVFMGAVV